MNPTAVATELGSQRSVRQQKPAPKLARLQLFAQRRDGATCPALLLPARLLLGRRRASAPPRDAPIARGGVSSQLKGQKALDIGYTGNGVLEHYLKYISFTPR